MSTQSRARYTYDYINTATWDMNSFMFCGSFYFHLCLIAMVSINTLDIQAALNGEESSRLVLTFETTCDNTLVGVDLGGVAVVKQYGRRLVLDLGVPFDLGIERNNFKTMFRSVQSVETDYLVGLQQTYMSQSAFKDSLVITDMNATDPNVDGTYISPATQTPLWNLMDSEPYSIHVEGVWHVTNSTPEVVVAVIDTGMADPARRIFLNLLDGYDFISDDGISIDGDGRDPDATDPGDWGEGCPTPSWHGTKVTSILAARHDSEFGMKGVAQNCSILPVRVLGLCRMGYATDVTDAIVWAAGGVIDGVQTNSNPARVISLSLAGKGACPGYLQSAINQAISLGSIVIAAAGNSNKNVSGYFPANCEGVIAVAASTREGTLAAYSNWGPLVAVAAPGGDSSNAIMTIGVDALETGLGVAYGMGTSFAAPHMAGVAALYIGLLSHLTQYIVYMQLDTVFLLFAIKGDCTHESMLCEKGIISADQISKMRQQSNNSFLESFASWNVSLNVTAETIVYAGGITVPIGSRCCNFNIYTVRGSDTLIECTQACLCTAGTYTSSQNQMSCSTCGGGTYSGTGWSTCASCSSCPADQYLSGCDGTSAGTCVWCDACTSGYYTPGCSGTSPGTCTPCNTCSSGYVMSGCSRTSAGSCVVGGDGVLCAPGGYSLDGVACTTCSSGSYRGVTVTPAWAPITFTPNTVWTSSWMGGSCANGYDCTTPGPCTYSGVFLNQPQYSCPYWCYGPCYNPQWLQYWIFWTVNQGWVYNPDVFDITLPENAAKYQYYYKPDLSKTSFVNDVNGGILPVPLLLPYASQIKYCYTCTVCNSGTIVTTPCSTSNDVICTACSAGKYSTGSGLTVCQDCSAGLYSNAASSTCIECVEGKYSAIVRTATCSYCLLGQYSSVKGATTCNNCTVGHYSGNIGASICISCSTGKYSSVIGASTCISCAAGKYSVTIGASLDSSCTPCAAGKYSITVGASLASNCTSCTAGTYSLGGATDCTLCASGTYISTPNATSCIQCIAPLCLNAPHYVQNCTAKSASVCVYCNDADRPLHSSLSSSNAVENICIWECDPFYFKFDNSTCLACKSQTSCAYNQYVTTCNTTNDGLCQNCSNKPLNSFYNGFSQLYDTNECSWGCNNGYRKDVTTLTCEVCTAGTDISVCTTCSAGKYANTSGLYECIPCLNGTYSTAVGATDMSVCASCSVGTYAAMAGSTVCAVCPVDTYAAVSGTTACVACSVGSHAVLVGSRVCSYCTSGQFATMIGSTECMACSTGTYSDISWATSCIPCPIGSYAGIVRATQCSLCPAGTYASSSITTACTSCSVGTYAMTVASTASTACIPCLPGTYSMTMNPTSCVNVFTWNASDYPNITSAPLTSYGQGGRSNKNSWFLPGNGVGIAWSAWTCTGGISCTPSSANGVWYLCSGINNPATKETFLQSAWGGTSTAYITFTSGVYNEFYFPQINSVLGFITFEVMCSSISCGASMNFGVDLNSNSNIDAGTIAEKGCGMSFGTRTSGSIVASDGTSTAYIANSLGVGTTWYRYRLLINIQAGTIRVDYKSLYTTVGVNNPQWITQIQDVDAKFNWGATNAQNPSLWDSIMFTSCKESVHVPWFIVTTYPVIGTYFNTLSQEIKLCDIGTYGVNAFLCSVCPIGTYSSTTGMSACSKCVVGSYALTNGSSVCTSCAVGTYMSQEGSANCTACAAGKFADHELASVCSNCPAGTYSSVASASLCTTCSFNTYTPTIGALNCTQCPLCSTRGYYMAGCSGTSSGGCDKCTNIIN